MIVGWIKLKLVKTVRSGLKKNIVPTEIAENVDGGAINM